MTIPELQKAIKCRGDAAKIARYAGVSESTIGRIIGGMRPNPGLITVEKIRGACQRLETERAKADSIKKADEKQKKSRKSSETAVAKAGA